MFSLNLVALFAVAQIQNASFTKISRSRNSGDVWHPAKWSLASNGVWFVTPFLVRQTAWTMVSTSGGVASGGCGRRLRRCDDDRKRGHDGAHAPHRDGQEEGGSELTMSKREKSRRESALDHFHGMLKADLADYAVHMFEELEELRKPNCESDNRKESLAAVVKDGRLVVSIGLDALDELRKRLGCDEKRVSAADIADFLTKPDAIFTGDRVPFEWAIIQATTNAKAWDDHHEETTEPSTEFMR